ncbi:hypothetical protein BDF20DRAFT_829740 [Mycotypha africana]|uniref:uncharacterized protein n=1 Tax=Mycotypha africana TaxID=64632 RepID=UPI0023019987|nr:uncharacterized protein BDF20DRAFT_829740 [Mycotypha africana]KAI8967373.1 hypothetical protein BDF20DRAFT_829740 [Mycotypha africana]
MKPENSTDTEMKNTISDAIDTETPRLKSLSVSDDNESKKLATENQMKKKKKKPTVGEDVFTRQSVKNWQEPRIKAWQSRYTSPEAFYFRFVTPGEGVKTGPWSPAEQALFMKRYNEWVEKEYKIGASWGMFSCAIPHRVGYQCMGNYRRLLSAGQLTDDSYETINGKLKQTNRGKPPGYKVPVMDKLGPEWEDEEVKEIEKNVDQWVKEFHAGSASLKKGPSRSSTAKKAAPRVLKTTSRGSSIGNLLKKMPSQNRETGTDYDFMIEAVDPEIAHLQQRDWETEWQSRLENYKKFLE